MSHFKYLGGDITRGYGKEMNIKTHNIQNIGVNIASFRKSGIEREDKYDFIRPKWYLSCRVDASLDPVEKES